MSIQTAEINENAKLAEVERKSEAYVAKYEEIFDAVSQSPHFSGSRQFSQYDAYALGEQFEMYNNYEMYTKESSSAGDLGTLPNIAVDLIAASYGISVAPLLSSVQTISDVQGLIYFKKLIGGMSRDGVTANDTIVDSFGGIAKSVDLYATEAITDETYGTGDGSTLTFAHTCAGIPVRSNMPITVKLDDTQIGVFQNGVFLSSNGATGTIVYSTGVCSIVFKTAPANTKAITISYSQDFEAATDIPNLEFQLTTDTITSQVLALKQTLSTIKSFQFNQRFGRLAEDEALNDLAGAMANIESVNVIKTIKALGDTNGSAAITFSKTVPSNISEYEYRQSFRYKLVDADKLINYNSGRGFANRYVAGHGFCAYLASLPKFVRTTENVAVGPHVYGYYDGAPVIRAPLSTGVATDDCYACYLSPTSPFEAPAVTATYMPVFITSTMQMGVNPLMNQRAIATMKGFKGTIPYFVQKMSLSA